MTAVVSGGIETFCSGKVYAETNAGEANMGQITEDAETNGNSVISLNELSDEKIYCVGSVSNSSISTRNIRMLCMAVL